jgi:hypothetical protein
VSESMLPDRPVPGDLATQWVSGLPFFPMRQVQSDVLVWHYTDVGGLKGIIENDEIWATSTSMMNDVVEIQYGIWMLNDIWHQMTQQHRESFPKTQITFVETVIETGSKLLLDSGCYIMCGSLESDSLSAWRGYAGGSGYSIGLESSAGKYAIHSSKRSLLKSPANRTPAFRKVLYDKQEQMTYTNYALEAIRLAAPSDEAQGPGSDEWILRLRSEPLLLFLTCATLLKHSGFADEREARLMFLSDEFSASAGTIAYRTGQLGVVPYLRVTGPHDGDNTFFTRDKKGRLPITKIMVGPARYPGPAISGLRSLLDHSGYEHVEILDSGVPFR